MKLSDFQDALQTLDWSSLERFVADLLLRSGQFTDVHLLGGADRGVDLVAYEKSPLIVHPRKWIFQIKKNRVIGRDVLGYLTVIKLEHSFSQPHPEICLVVPGNVTARVREELEKQGIHLWDVTKLAELVTPEILQLYFGPAVGPLITGKDLSDRSSRYLTALGELPSGHAHWSQYQRLVADILEYLFCPPLEPPRYELSDADTRNRRDLIFENSASEGFWAQIRATYAAHYVVADAKNHASVLKKAPVVDIAHYLKPYGCGMFALLISRRGAAPSANHAVREQWIGAEKLILPLSDDHLREMLTLKGAGGRPEEIIRRRIADFRMAL